jgi:branched-chain amino acid transport system substrate-binding protein
MEFGLTQRQKLAAFLPFITDIKAIGLQSAQGLLLTTAYYLTAMTPAGDSHSASG